MISFAYPQLIWLLIMPFLAYYMLPIAGKMHGDALQVPFVDDISKINDENKYRFRTLVYGKIKSYWKLLMLSVIWALWVAALCRPQWVGEPRKVHVEARDIMLVVDISPSMQEQDFLYQGKYYSRLAAVKSVVSAFADARIDDQIGLIVFGSRAYQQVPLTYDRQSLKEVLYSLDGGMAGNSTSIGDAIGLALKNLSADATPAKNKVIVLLTDGINNDGRLSFPQAVKMAEQEQIKIYTIGMASDRLVWGGLFGAVSADLDETALKQLAQATKGNYFRATDLQSLYAVYNEINRLEAQAKEGQFVQEQKDLFYYPLTLALILFALLFALSGEKIR